MSDHDEVRTLAEIAADHHGVPQQLILTDSSSQTAVPTAQQAELPQAGRWLHLVPVEHFGMDEECQGCGNIVEFNYGLSDAVSGWSDCNRAIGHIFRVDDLPAKYRQPGESIRIWVAEEDIPALTTKVWQDGPTRPATLTRDHQCPPAASTDSSGAPA